MGLKDDYRAQLKLAAEQLKKADEAGPRTDSTSLLDPGADHRHIAGGHLELAREIRTGISEGLDLDA